MDLLRALKDSFVRVDAESTEGCVFGGYSVGLRDTSHLILKFWYAFYILEELYDYEYR